MSDTLGVSIAAAVRSARAACDWSVSVLAERSGVSRAMIAKIERGDAQPTAALLSRIATALGMTLSELVAQAEGDENRLRRVNDQPVWTDPETGYTRRAVSPATGAPLELVEVDLPAGARVPYPADSYAFIHQQIWVLEGHLRFHEGDTVHELDVGDCLALGAPTPCAFVNPTRRVCRYLVALTKRVGH